MGSYSRAKYVTQSTDFPRSADSKSVSASYATFADLPASSTTIGNTAFVVATNKLYIWSGVGWYLVAEVTNASPSAISGVDGAYSLAIDGTATTITAVSTDPEGFALTWSYAVTSGSLAVTPAASAIAVVNNGAGAYTLSGDATGDNSNVDIVVGQTVNFTVNASGHPFYIRDSDGGANVSSPAATGQGATSGVVSWTPNTAGTYYYQCGNHAAMVGTITVGAATVSATVAQADNVFTITPSTNTAAANTFSLTFNVTDGLNGSVSAVSAFTLAFSVTNSRYTALSVKATGPGSNQTFDDASTSNHTITAVGNSTASTFSPYRHGGYSTYFDGTGDYLNLNGDAEFAFGTNDFTVEFWVYLTALNGSLTMFCDFRGSSGNGLYTALFLNTDSTLTYWHQGGSRITSTATIPLNAWSHIALTRSGYDVKLFINGQQEGSTFTNSLSQLVGTNGPSFGNDNSGSFALIGYMSDIRILNGTAAYTSNFTPPTAPLTAVTNTKFLLGNLPYLKDQSASNHTITVNGDPSLKPFSLFDNAAYSEASHGASAYFDGSGDYLTGPTPATIGIGTGDFTIECWFYATDATTDKGVWDTHTNASNSDGLTLTRITATTFRVWQSSQILVSSATDITDHWNHLAVVRNSGTLELFVNGVSQGTVSNSANLNSAQGILIGGGRYSGTTSPTQFVKGYIQDFRVTTSAVYTSAFTPPTAPLTAITNTKFLLNPETSISDLSQSSTITCFGNTATSTTQAKFSNTRSIYGDGSGDYVSMPIDPIGTDDFTVEAWIYPTSTGSLDAAISGITIGGAKGVVIRRDKWFIGDDSTYQTFASSANKFVTNQWQHIAITRQGTSLKLFYNGTQFDSGTNSTDLDQTKYVLFASYTDGSYLSFAGYIQDFRITKGLARYTASFTPPTELQG